MSSLTEKAQIFAAERHAGQVRQNKARQPYTTHLEDVATLVRESGGSDEEIAGGWLHDVVEDTAATLDEIGEHFGPEVRAIVDGMTDPPDFSGLATLVRKTGQAKRVRSKSDSVKRVKIADQTSNLRSMAVGPPVKWDKYKCLDYIKGAYLIAQECRGVSEYLDSQFQKAYQAAFKVYEQ